MSKARVLADFISDGSTFADGAISVSEVSGAAPLASPTFTGTVGATTITSTTGLTLNTTDANGTGIALGLDGDKKVRFYDDQGATTKMYWNASTATQKFEDNSKLVFGSSEDLKLYHDGFNSYLDEMGTGDLRIRANNLLLKNASGEDYLTATSNGSVSIAYDNSTKLATSSTGVDITGKTTTDELDLNALAATIADTAVDVFVYDTRKDSDGGAWRKRTQHTSWYNETLNTATRGSRREFPAVAVIVITSAEQTSIMVYDGDDPDLPLWMSFNRVTTNGDYTLAYSSAPTAVSALNGIISFGSNLGVGTINFIADNSYRRRSAGGGVAGYYLSGIADRNAGSGFEANNDTSIVDNTVNDVAMTVLPNAPIDAATGLPVPTIAVATDGGVSVIKDDGTVVDIKATNASFYYSHQVSFTDDGKIILLYSYFGVADDTHVYYTEIPSSDKTFTAHSSAINANLDSNSYVTFLPQYSNQGSSLGGSKILATNQFYGGNAAGLVQYDPENDLTKSLAADITSTYNTGWMNGDIKLATLSDTDATNVTGSELVTNGTFDSNITGWFARNSDATLSHQSGELRVENANAALGEAYQSISLTAGVTYTFSANITAINTSHAQFFLSTGTTGTSGTVAGAQYNTTGVKSFTYTPTSSGTYYIVLGHRGANVAGYYAQYDNISARVAEKDRSVNGNGLQVFGTVTKSAVASGADLVAYSGFSSSNYLQQPYNSGLDFGTGDWCYMWWQKMDSVTNGMTVFGRDAIGEGGTSAGRIGCYFNSDKLRVDLTDDGASSYTGKLSSQSVVGLTGWNCFVIIRRGSNFEFYINGKFDSSVALGATGDGSYTNTSATLSIGYDVNVGAALSSGALALFRASATAPSPEQIKKIYEDEKVLFQEGAQATLAGTSDAVTSLAYDDDQQELLVGTSQYTSVFRGLRRVEEISGSASAISASNGLRVIED